MFFLSRQKSRSFRHSEAVVMKTLAISKSDRVIASVVVGVGNDAVIK